MKRGDIYLLKLEHDNGSVQAGTRPVIIVQNNIGNAYSTTTIVCSITAANKKYLPTHLMLSTNGGLEKPSLVLCEQIFTVNQSDLKQYIGTISNKHIMKQLERCILISLGIKKEYKYD